jgi:hypothetical protein
LDVGLGFTAFNGCLYRSAALMPHHQHNRCAEMFYGVFDASGDCAVNNIPGNPDNKEVS